MAEAYRNRAEVSVKDKFCTDCIIQCVCPYAFAAARLRFPFFWDMAARHWVIGARRIETA